MDIKFYSLDETAKILGLHKRTTERYLLAGKLKGAKFGKAWRISEDDIKAFYNSAKEETADQIQSKGI